MAEYRLSPRAQRDLDGIFNYTAAQWGLSQALRYTDLVEAVCSELAAAPHLAQKVDSIRQGYCRRRVESHLIYFRPTHYGIAAIRVLHQRMEAGRHL